MIKEGQRQAALLRNDPNTRRGTERPKASETGKKWCTMNVMTMTFTKRLGLSFGLGAV